jgi:phosphoserine phosphatase RsbU/P
LSGIENPPENFFSSGARCGAALPMHKEMHGGIAEMVYTTAGGILLRAAGRMASNTGERSTYRPFLWVIAVVFAVATMAYSVAWMYYIHQPIQVEIGIDTAPVDSGLRITSTYKDSPAEHAGLRAKDILLAINGRSLAQPAQGRDILNAIWLKSQAGQTVTLLVHRDGAPQPLVIQPVFRTVMHGFGDRVSLARRGAAEIIGIYPLLFLVVGLAVLFLRLEDSNAWVLALMFAGFITEADLPVAFVLLGDTPRHFLYAYATIMKSLLPGLFYFFFAVFPTRSPIDRKLPWLKWLLLATGACLGWGGIRHGDFEALPFIAALFSHSAIGLTRLITAYGTVLLGMLSLLLNVIGAPNVEDRRKLKVMLWGTLVGITPAVIIGIPYDLSMAEMPFWLSFARGVFLFVIPLSFAYAVVKHRVMDIPVLLRRSARYLLVERGFAIFIAIISIGITLWFGQAFSRQFSAGSKAAIPVGATFGILLISGATQVHRRVRTRLDRAFFRSAYDAQQILEHLAAKTLTVTSREDLAELLHDEIRDALHPRAIYIYLQSGEGRLLAYAGNPPAEALTVSPDEPILRQLAERGDPLELDPDRLRGTQLGPLRAECLVPILGTSAGMLQGLAALGPRLSDEPYSTGDKRLLASVASQAGIAMRSISLAEKMAERMESERRSEQEMEIARQVQMRLLPQQAPVLATLECAGKVIQTRAVGGDYFDFLDFGSGRLGVVLADISGKGMSGALLMANLQANLRSQYALALEDPCRLLRSVNHLFYKNTENNHYATTFFAVYDDESRKLRYVNCGHNPPILLHADGNIERLEATATVLGLFAEWDCEVADRPLADGDVLVIYTDGISEAAACEEGEEYGEDRLVAVIKANQHKPASEILDAIIADVQTFSAGEQSDDMTLIVACRR